MIQQILEPLDCPSPYSSASIRRGAFGGEQASAVAARSHCAKAASQSGRAIFRPKTIKVKEGSVEASRDDDRGR
jgi:hypothetical protein